MTGKDGNKDSGSHPCSHCQTLTVDQTWRFVCVILLNFIANLQIRNLGTKEIVQGRAQGHRVSL